MLQGGRADLVEAARLVAAQEWEEVAEAEVEVEEKVGAAVLIRSRATAGIA